MKDLARLKIELTVGGSLYAMGCDSKGRIVFDGRDHKYSVTNNAVKELAQELKESLGVVLPDNADLAIGGSMLYMEYFDTEKFGRELEVRKNDINGHYYLAPKAKPMERGSRAYIGRW